MDLGALELQIFVSLVVVLGSAFVALICDYLKGNNEQLRERNIELRVRTEERERFAILNPSAWLSQFRGHAGTTTSATGAPVAPVAAESVMQSHATVESLAQVADREAALANRAEPGEGGLAEVPSVAGFDISERRKSRRKRALTSETAANAGENSYDWVRPEVMARVARRAGGGQREAEELVAIQDETAAVTAEVPLAAPQLAAPMDAEKPMAPAAAELPVAVGFGPLERQAEMEQVAKSKTGPASMPPVIMLRPLPAMKLSDELQRIADSAQVAQSPFTSQLLEDVIAASAAKPSDSSAFAANGEHDAASPQMEQEPGAGMVVAFAGEGQVVPSAVEEPETVDAFSTLEHAIESRQAPSAIVAPAAEAPEADYAYSALEEAAERVDASPMLTAVPVEAPETVYSFNLMEDAGESERAPRVDVEPLVVEPETAYAYATAENSVELMEAPPMVEQPSVVEPETAYTFASFVDAAESMDGPPAAIEPFAFEMRESVGIASAHALESSPETSPEPPPFVEELPFPELAPIADAQPFVAETSPAFAAVFPTYDSLPPVVETPAYDWSGAEFAPIPETVFASEAFAAETYAEIPNLDPISVGETPAQPDLVPVSEQPPVMPAETLSELLLPTGMQDQATYWRLLEMPNPMSGIVITISITDFSKLSASLGEKDLPPLLDSVEILMSSMVRDGDFGVKVAEDQWVFVYRIDDNGFSQRRVAGLSEKLWDFQLRHLGLSNISFSWAAVNVHAERLSDGVTAAVERMEASRRGTKKSGAERARLVVNG